MNRLHELLSRWELGVDELDDPTERALVLVNVWLSQLVVTRVRRLDVVASAVAARIRNAGAIFVGAHAPVSLGDYCAGSNHVLPTGGCACHSSGLSVRAFTKSVHVVDYSREALAEVAGHVVALSGAEDLPAHGQAVRVRFER